MKFPEIMLCHLKVGARIGYPQGASMSWFERLVFKKIELWVVVLLAVFGVVGTVMFGAIAKNAASGERKYGRLGTAVLMVADVPDKIEQVATLALFGDPLALKAKEARFGEQKGFKFSYPAGTRPDSGYVLLSRYDGAIQRSVVELVDLNSQEQVYRWQPDIEQANALSKKRFLFTNVQRDNRPTRARVFHPILTNEGALLFQGIGPLAKFDACNDLIWAVDGLFHHSNEPHPDGGYWVAEFEEPQTVPGVGEKFKEDVITHVSVDGQVLFRKSVPQLMIENGLGRYVYGQDFYSDDPLHLNDIQPAMADGPYWKRGDVFLSLRNISAIVQYRPSTNEVVWMKQGPWVNQHDVDVLPDGRLSVFNNNKYNYRWNWAVNGSNDVMVYDFETDTVSSPYLSMMQDLEVRTISEGLAEILPNGDVIVEEGNYGRLVQFSEKEVAWSYVNRLDKDTVHLTNWSRHVPREFGDAVAKKLAEVSCN